MLHLLHLPPRIFNSLIFKHLEVAESRKSVTIGEMLHLLQSGFWAFFERFCGKMGVDLLNREKCNIQECYISCYILFLLPKTTSNAMLYHWYSMDWKLRHLRLTSFNPSFSFISCPSHFLTLPLHCESEMGRAPWNSLPPLRSRPNGRDSAIH